MELWIAALTDLAVFALLVASWRCGAAAANGSAISPPAHVLWRPLALLAAAVAVMLAAIALVLFNIELLRAPSEKVGFSLDRKVPDARTDPKIPPDCSSSMTNVLYMTIQAADIRRDTAQVEADLCLNNETLLHLRLHRTGLAPLDSGVRPVSLRSLPSDFESARFTVIYHGLFPQAVLSHGVSVHDVLSAIAPDTGERQPARVGTFTVPLVGSAPLYPLDEYSGAGLWSVGVPGATDLITGRGRTLFLSPLKRLVANPGTSLRWYSGTVPNQGVGLQGRRTGSPKLFVMVLSLLPIILFAALLGALAATRKEHETSTRLPAEVLVGVAAFLVAVLPIRAVLVPAEVSGLTLVDYALGMEMALMVAATLLVVVAGLVTPSSGRQELVTAPEDLKTPEE